MKYNRTMIRLLVLGWVAVIAISCGGRTASDQNDGSATVDSATTLADAAITVDANPAADATVGSDAVLPLDLGQQDNGSCTNAIAVGLSGGKALIQGSTANHPNEFGTSVNCGSGGLDGNQSYYKLKLDAKFTYRMTLNTKFVGYLYVFSGCNAATINADCRSGGATGVISERADGANGATVFFAPAKSGDYLVAIDSTSTQQSGDFSLLIEAIPPPSNDSCSASQRLTLSAGKATVNGSTGAATNVFGNLISCGNPFVLAGPQVFYKVNLEASKSYRVALTPKYGARFFIFGDTCDPAQINSQCAAGPAPGLLAEAGSTQVAVVKPEKTGDFTIAIGGRNASNRGDFALSIETFTPPTNGTCKAAQLLTLQNGAASVKADTTGIADEFGGNLRCGNFGVGGPQLYYDVKLEQAKTYKVRVTSDYEARFYLFGDTCDQQTISSHCGSGGQQGFFNASTDLYPRATIFTPTQTATYRIAVDGRSSGDAGSFELDVKEFTAATNATCAAAAAVALSTSGATTISGDTTGVTNEFGPSINCGQGRVIGPQVYYKLKLEAKKYDFTFKPLYSGGRLYLARANCDAQAINADCRSNGVNGATTGSLRRGDSASFSVTPAAAGDYLLIVDGLNDGLYGEFTVDVKSAP
ncbi:MAG: hypothetical protein H6707_12895 [Deltaproteobacteria bacterium]|nr:hypothetical protein [Deltaproteobacteria bacterium]